MLPADTVLTRLRRRGDLWESAPGMTGLRGATLVLLRRLESAIAALAQAETADEWLMPAGIAFETLERAEYFASFPQWLTAASHLSGDERILASIAAHESPAAAARHSLEPADVALPPAVCYHTYAALAGRRLHRPFTMTAEQCCWRHEGERLRSLERGWAFRMREIVCIAAPAEVEQFRQRGMAHAGELAGELGLDTEIVEASDPFFAPTARGKAALQKLKALKHELSVSLPDVGRLAIASFNNHERFFGNAFSISLRDGSSAASACVAFGLDRWLLAFLAVHGTDPGAWPQIRERDAAGPYASAGATA